ncbi:MAG: hypothetical protein K5910_01490 [Bacteroidales bacterium]|nr:hypothetical protein [Bacteroidales bacterium]
MNQNESLYHRFGLLTEQRPAPADFPAACRLLHATPGVLDEMIFRELGISGEELLMRMPNLICDCLQK